MLLEHGNHVFNNLDFIPTWNFFPQPYLSVIKVSVSYWSLALPCHTLTENNFKPILFQVSDERREQGTINNTKEGFGFIQCADRDAKIFFHFSECLDVSRQPKEGDDCEFTVADDPNHPGQLMATR